jgi:hypothetical protein
MKGETPLRKEGDNEGGPPLSSPPYERREVLSRGREAIVERLDIGPPRQPGVAAGTPRVLRRPTGVSGTEWK